MKRLIFSISLAIVLLFGVSSHLEGANNYIGSEATNRPAYGTFTQTFVNRNNPAAVTGNVTTVKLWAYEDLYEVEVATFYVVQGDSLSTRDNEFIGDVTAGSQQTFSTNLRVEVGDFLGIYASAGKIDYSVTGGLGLWHSAGVKAIPCTNKIFYPAGEGLHSLQGVITPSPPPDPSPDDIQRIITDDGFYNAFGDIAQLPNDDLLVVYRKGCGHSLSAGIYYKISTDNGASWGEECCIYSDLVIVADTVGVSVLGDGTIIVGVDLRGSNYQLIPNGFCFFRSVDFGQTWSDMIRPSVNGSGLSWGGGARVIELSDGSLRISFACLPEGYQWSEYPAAVHMISSLDKGLTWGNERVVTEGLGGEGWNEPCLVYLGGCDILCLLRYGNYTAGAYTHGVNSEDGGATWSSPTPKFLNSSKPCATLLPNGDLIAILRHDALGGAPRDEYITIYRISNDNGNTWSGETQIGEGLYMNLYGGAVGIMDGTDTIVYVVYFVETGTTTAQVRFAKVTNSWEEL